VQQSSGLRFDVYERVHLPQDAADIREIEEIELTPFVQAESRGEQVVLRGSLLLGGVYLPDGGSGDSRQLEHWIPVEITLPMERVESIDDLAVEVDNFDYDLLDGRTLNITGVLTLRGVRADAAGSRQQAYAWGEEPYTVVHRRGSEPLGESGADAVGEDAPAAGGDASAAGEEALSFFADESLRPDAETAEWRSAGGQDSDGPETRAAGDDAAGAAEADAARSCGAFADAAPPDDDAAGEPLIRSEAAGTPEKAACQAVGPAAGAEAERTEFSRTDAPEGESVSDSQHESVPGGAVVRSGPGAARAEEAVPVGAQAEGRSAEASPFGAQAEGRSAEASPFGAQAENPSAEAVPVGAQPDEQTAQPREPFPAHAAPSGYGGASQSAPGRADLKVAFGAKREEERTGTAGYPGLGKLFFPDRQEARGEAGTKAPTQAREASEPQQACDSAEEERRRTSSDEVDWKRLFGGAAAQEAFRTVRLCIVQKDDTLDAIAGRYQRNPREIALANRLEGSTVTEGQVLLIP